MLTEFMQNPALWAVIFPGLPLIGYGIGYFHAILHLSRNIAAARRAVKRAEAWAAYQQAIR